MEFKEHNLEERFNHRCKVEVKGETREWRARNGKGPVCDRRAIIQVGDEFMCRTHAKEAALEYLLVGRKPEPAKQIGQITIKVEAA